MQDVKCFGAVPIELCWMTISNDVETQTKAQQHSLQRKEGFPSRITL